jgi:hypothetical protein
MILYSPYNESSVELCTNFFNNTITCSSETYAEYGFGEDKINWFCNVNQTLGMNISCISYVKDIDGGIVQTNPSYDSKSDTLITEPVEDRTSFPAEKGLVQVYFSKDNLIFDGRDYVFGVRCSDGTEITQYEKISVPEYENINMPITRWFWLGKNINGLLIGLFLCALVLGLVGYAYSKIRKG